MRSTNALRLALAAGLGIVLPACAPRPPDVPYLTVGIYSGECGYDWNGAAAHLKDVPRLAKRWDGPREMLMVFRFEPVPEACVDKARAVYRGLGFRRVYIVTMPMPKRGDPPLVPGGHIL
jgi:hypothetical protein